MRNFRHDIVQGQMGGAAVDDVKSEAQMAKHYLCFMVTSLGASGVQFVCGRHGLHKINEKSLVELTTRCISDLLVIAGLHVEAVVYDGAKENDGEPPPCTTLAPAAHLPYTHMHVPAQPWQRRLRVWGPCLLRGS